MLVKAKDKEISFLFQETDPFFEIGCRILEQEHIDQMLPYKRRQQNGMEKLIFQAKNEDTVLLSEVAPQLGEDDRYALLCEMLYLCKKIEENGFLKKECIWFKYDNIYYDKSNGRIMTAILPITGEFRYADGGRWFDYFEESVKYMASWLPPDKAEYVGKIVMMVRSGKFGIDAALDEIRQHAASGTAELPDASDGGQKVSLRLLYSGRGGRLEFMVDDRDFLIGRNAGLADGVIDTGLSSAVSRKHCLITKMNNKYFVQDLKSVNHTLVNGIMIPPYELMELENNDILSVADIEFRVLKNSVDAVDILK